MESPATQGTSTQLGPVLPKCSDSLAPGHWYCIDHHAAFPHNMALESHVETKGNHVIAWVCDAHGPEVP